MDDPLSKGISQERTKKYQRKKSQKNEFDPAEYPLYKKK